MVLQKKKSGGGNGNKENENGTTTVVLKLDFHCDGCASKITRHLRALQGFIPLLLWLLAPRCLVNCCVLKLFLLAVEGVETVKAESDAGKVTVTGKLDPVKVRDNLAEKMKKKVEIVSPQPKKDKDKDKEKEKEENKDAKTNNKNQDKKNKDKEVRSLIRSFISGPNLFLFYFILLSLPLPAWDFFFILIS